MADPAGTDPSPAEQEVADLCSQLIRFDTSNYGDDSGPGEREAAEWVAERLADVGLDPVVHESVRGRASVVARWEGADSSREALLVHGHLDVVPADPADWQVDPFSGEVRDGCVWGRGAVDMKDMDAMTLAVVRQWRREGRVPPRDVVLAFVADEEAGGGKGARFLVDEHPDLFEGCSEGISEVGGFSFTVAQQRLYAIETAQKGMAWMRLTARGTAGHGSMLQADNAVARLGEAVARLGSTPLPVHLTDTVRRFLEEIAEVVGVAFDPADPEAMLPHVGPLARIVGATLRNTANPTMLQAGYKHNVVPQSAHAMVDGRFLPGHADDLEREVDELVGPGITREWVHHDVALETSFDGRLVDAMSAALTAEDPGARVLPYCLSGGTDAKSFSRLGIRGFGFAPLRLPDDLDFSAMFHGVDERVPVESLQFGTRVLDRFLATC